MDEAGRFCREMIGVAVAAALFGAVLWSFAFKPWTGCEAKEHRKRVASIERRKRRLREGN